MHSVMIDSEVIIMFLGNLIQFNSIKYLCNIDSETVFYSSQKFCGIPQAKAINKDVF